MEFKISQKPSANHRLYIVSGSDKLEAAALTPEEIAYVGTAFTADQSFITINRYSNFIFISLLKEKKTDSQTSEAIRKAGVEAQAVANKHKIVELTITNLSTRADAAVLMAEGIALANYQFLKYRTEAKKLTNTLVRISFTKESATVKEVTQLGIIVEAIYKARTLVNEPLSYLSAEQLSKEISAIGKEGGFKVTVFNKARIEKEGMGGLLSVNRGSIDPPTFSIMEYVPKKAINKKPLVLIGKGVVYDTGGVSLKPTANSMDRMKSDMSGAALVTGAMYAIAQMQLPIHVIALVPATDNRPGENAYVPGDVIKMMSGATVEVLNTDAEGRMLLGDALHFAKRYNPQLVVDFATLTGAASAAVGEHGIVCMGTAGDDVKQAFRDSGFRQYERLVEYPLWDEYGDQIKSDIADIKNIGGATGGAITAGKFLEHFTDYPWMHFDIAGVSFNVAKKGYYPIGGTAYGMRMLLDFVSHMGKS
ncbi:peptidase M17 [Flavipsychrobacter stenotrophus]|uniref:Peptidase M17 n=1 Tax=Flavipsychrobacter stenotrophus TaxID=2077091 RepID=A0A2S7SQF9_9BACT|nr:leucyl aminopeptidase family protein [Flavipsychrobacter stenotrophus]PQJ08861.1 peptidase M17 [Flavipsychrobacter stenotrophus]